VAEREGEAGETTAAVPPPVPPRPDYGVPIFEGVCRHTSLAGAEEATLTPVGHCHAGLSMEKRLRDFAIVAVVLRAVV
jgi:hypothetical protein